MATVAIIVKNEIEGIHYYEGAPDEVSFLRFPHRHIFKVETEIEVFHDDRELEFIMVQRRIDAFLKDHLANSTHKSCEMIAKAVIGFIREQYPTGYMRDGSPIKRGVICSVFEDGENGARVRDWRGAYGG